MRSGLKLLLLTGMRARKNAVVNGQAPYDRRKVGSSAVQYVSRPYSQAHSCGSASMRTASPPGKMVRGKWQNANLQVGKRNITSEQHIAKRQTTRLWNRNLQFPVFEDLFRPEALLDSQGLEKERPRWLFLQHNSRTSIRQPS